MAGAGHPAPEWDGFYAKFIFLVGYEGLGQYATWERDRGRLVALGPGYLSLAVSGDWDFTHAAGVASLLVLPSAHEDLAILFGAYLVVAKLLPAGLVALCIYAGMVASDLALYSVGAAARQLPWLGRYAVDDRVRRFGHGFNRNLFGLFALCRLAPGAVFIALIACGWTRVPLARFAAASALMSALYLPIMLYLAIVFGEALSAQIGGWTWPFLLVAMAALAYVRQRVFAFGGVAEANEGVEIEFDRRRGLPVVPPR
jgi:membrane protein DedA with SNARE-associated domain